MASNKVGEAFVEVRADTAPFKKELKSAEQQTERSANKMGGAFGRVGASIEKATEPARKFQGSISSAIGVIGGLTAAITTVAAAVQKFSEYMRDGKKAADELISSLYSAGAGGGETAVEQRLSAIRDRLTELDGEIAFKLENPISGVFTRRMGQIQEEIDSLRDSERSLVGQLQAIRARAAEAAEDERKQLEAANTERERAVALDAEINEMKQAHLEAERAIAEERRRADQERLAQEQRASQLVQERVRMQERLLDLARQTHSLGLSGSALNISSSIHTLGARRTRTGP